MSRLWGTPNKAEHMTQEQPVWLTAADGTRLFARHYPSSPDRPLCLCLHGLTRNSRDFDGFAPRLAAEGYPVLALDMRGRGESDNAVTPADYSIETYVADCLAWLDQLGVRRAVWIGSCFVSFIDRLSNRP